MANTPTEKAEAARKHKVAARKAHRQKRTGVDPKAAVNKRLRAASQKKAAQKKPE